MSNRLGLGITILATGKNVATSGTSAGTTLPTTQSGTSPVYVRVATTAAAYVRVGKGAQTAVNTDMLVQPGDSVILAVAGCDNIAALQVTAAGVLQVSPLENG